MTYIVLTNKGPLLFYKNCYYFHLRYFFYFNLLNIRAVSLELKYIKIVNEKYQILPSKVNFPIKHLNWACKIICPWAINYWKRWDVTFPFFGFFNNWEVSPVLKFLNSTAVFEKNCLTIKYDLKDTILICHWVVDIIFFMQIKYKNYKIGVQINGKFWNNFREIDLFTELIKTNEIKVFGCYEYYQILIAFNGKLIF